MLRFGLGRLFGRFGAQTPRQLEFGFAASPLASGAALSRATAGKRFDATGTLVSESMDAPRWDHMPGTLAPRGLLVEPQRTNLLLQSNGLGDAVWAKNRGTVSMPGDAFAGVAAAKFTSDGATGEHGVAHGSVTLSAGATYTMWAIVRKSGWRYVALRTNAIANLYRNVVFDLDEGTISYAGTGYTGAITALGGGWYRIEARFTAENNASFVILDFNATAITSDAGPSCAGDGASGGWVAHAQIEGGMHASSPIATTTGTVTRAADVLTVNLPAGSYEADVYGGTVSISGTKYTSVGVSPTAGTWAFSWPTAAVAAGERHLQRLVLRRVG